MSTQLEDWPQQATQGHKIPGSRYTSKEFLEQEWEGMWTKAWLLLGREAELPNFGDWQKEELGREEILMVRQKDGSVKAFYNVCQHRAIRWLKRPKDTYYNDSFASTTAGRFYPMGN